MAATKLSSSEIKQSYNIHTADVARPWMTQSPRWWEQPVMAATKLSSSEIIQSYNIHTADVARPWMTQSPRWWEQPVMAATKLSSSEIKQSLNIYTAEVFCIGTYYEMVRQVERRKSPKGPQWCVKVPHFGIEHMLIMISIKKHKLGRGCWCLLLRFVELRSAISENRIENVSAK